jgi:hypothetical protein
MKIDAADIVAIIIAVSLAGVVLMAIWGVVFAGRTLSDQGAHALSTICGALLSVLSMIVAGKVKNRRKDLG